MSAHNNAARAYSAAQGRRSVRDQEADLFLRVNEALRQSRDAGRLPLVRALADAGRLWSAVIDLVRDPDNALPVTLRASIVSVGLAVQREVGRISPDIDFIIAVNTDVAAGLASHP